MPEICRFHGIVIKLFFNDHAPPHFHAEHEGKVAEVHLNPLHFYKGRLAPRAERLVLKWASLHRSELLEAWDKSARRQNPGKIAPLP